MTDTRRTRTFGDNNPIHSHPAAWDGHRSVRLIGENFNLGLATTAYSYALSYDEVTEVAERIVLLWNLHRGVSTDDLRTPTPAIEAMGEWTDNDRAKAWRDALDSMHRRAMRAEAVVRENWSGQHWRAVNHKQADEVRAVLGEK